MIIFVHKPTGRIIGTIEGRVHSEEQRNMFICPDNIDKSEVERVELEYEPIFENKRDKQGRKVKKLKELLPDKKYRQEVLEVEKGQKKMLDFKVDLDENNKVTSMRHRPRLSSQRRKEDIPITSMENINQPFS